MRRIGYLGSPGSFSHAAALQYAPESKLHSVASFADLFTQADEGIVDESLIPIENSLAGVLYENYDRLEQSNVSIVAEEYVKVEHMLLSGVATDISRIKKVYSHPKALEQCSGFLQNHPHIQTVAVSDTTEAAKIASRNTNGEEAAIASSSCTRIYGLHTVGKHVEDNSSNYTRFLVVQPRRKDASTGRKCSIVALLPHTKGSLVEFLSTLADAGANMTQIVSRPIHGKPFEYRFYVDFIADSPGDLVTQLGQRADVKNLGIYDEKRVK